MQLQKLARARSALAGPLIYLSLSLSACASLPAARHVATVSVVTAHSTLSMVQSVEMLVVCGRTTAPQPPQCVPIELHQELSKKLLTAFDLDGQVAHIVRDLPVGSPQPAKVAELIGEIINLVDSVIAAIPDSPRKVTLVESLAQGGK